MYFCVRLVFVSYKSKCDEYFSDYWLVYIFISQLHGIFLFSMLTTESIKEFYRIHIKN